MFTVDSAVPAFVLVPVVLHGLRKPPAGTSRSISRVWWRLPSWWPGSSAIVTPASGGRVRADAVVAVSPVAVLDRTECVPARWSPTTVAPSRTPREPAPTTTASTPASTTRGQVRRVGRVQRDGREEVTEAA